MNFNFLSNKITSVHNELQTKAKSAVNILLTVRNWLVGYYIVEYEQHGEDRAKYGDELLKILAKSIKEKGVDGFSFTNLNLYRQFYNCYPEIMQTLSAQLDKKLQSPTELLERAPNTIVQSLTEQFTSYSFTVGERVFSKEKVKLASAMLQSLSFTHIAQLLPLIGLYLVKKN